MSDAKLRSICATVKHFIDMTRAELMRLDKRIGPTTRGALERSRD